MSIRKVIWTAWSNSWKGNRTGLIRGIVMLMRDRPIMIFLFAACFTYGTWPVFIAFLLGVILHQFLNDLFSRLAVLRVQKELWKGAIARYGIYQDKGLVIQKFEVSEFLDPETYDDIDRFFVKRMTAFAGVEAFSLNEVVRIYNCEVPGMLNGNLSCYWIALKSYLFVQTSPKEKDPFQKFCILHELGHASLSFANEPFFAKHGFRLLMFFIILLMWLLPFHWAWTVWTSLGILTITIISARVSVWGYGRVSDEMLADMFAFGYMTTSELRRLKSLVDKFGSLFKDGSLNEAENEIRLREFKRNLVLATEDRMEEVQDRAFSSVYKPTFAIMILEVLAAALPAFYIKSFGWKDCLLILCLTFGTILVYGFMFFKWLTVDKLILKRLDDWIVMRKRSELSADYLDEGIVH